MIALSLDGPVQTRSLRQALGNRLYTIKGFFDLLVRSVVLPGQRDHVDNGLELSCYLRDERQMRWTLQRSEIRPQQWIELIFSYGYRLGLF